VHISKRAQGIIGYLFIIAFFTVVAFQLNAKVKSNCEARNENSVRTNFLIDTLSRTALEFGNGTRTEIAARVTAYQSAKADIQDC
jgi:hypothetical protein